MKRQFLIAIIALLTATIGHAANNLVIVDGVTYEWSSSEQGYIVTGWDEETPIKSLHIRGEVNGLDVVGIADEAFNPDNYADEDFPLPLFESVEIDEGITYIGSNAFIDCTAIKWVRMPSTLRTIGDDAFNRCLSLEYAFLNEGLETIGTRAFSFCSSLTIMIIPSTVKEIQSGAFLYCNAVTDVYFLMDEAQLEDFEGWWDGIYRDEHNIGGTEFNGSRLASHNPVEGTHCHVPQGMLEAYELSGEFDEWLLEEDNNCYPLWWIVNFGVVGRGREYTVSDDLTAVYVDVEDGLYAKDDNHWLTPDRIYPGEIDYMRTTGLMKEKNNEYDQSNWVVLTNVSDPRDYLETLIAGGTITGTLVDKKNPVIEVSDDATLESGAQSLYEKNVYIPASFMGRSQLGANDKTYAFVQPKPQELITVDWTIYCEDDECFYLPKPDGEGINGMELTGGVKPCYDLYEQLPVPYLEDCGYYAFNAINRRISASPITKGLLKDNTPYVAGGVSDKFVVCPLELPDEPPMTGVADIVADFDKLNNVWYSIDGRCLGSVKPTTPGLYINGSKKVLVTQ